MSNFSTLSLSAYGSDIKAGITSIEYDEESKTVLITSDTTYKNAVVYAAAYNKQKLVAVKSATKTIYSTAEKSSGTKINLNNFDSEYADYVKVMVMKSKSSFMPLCKVYDFDETYLNNYRQTYAYITDAYYNSLIDEAEGKVTLSMVTKDGYVNYSVADNLKFIGADGSNVVLSTDDMISGAANKLSGSLWEELSKINMSVGDAIVDKFNKDIIAHNNDDAALRTVFLTLNSNREIDSITPLISATSECQFDYKIFEGVYDSEKKTVGTSTFSDKLTIIYINYDEPSKSSYMRNTSLFEQWEYKGIAIGSDSDFVYNCAVITDYSADYTIGDSIAVVKNTYQMLNSKGEKCFGVNVVKEGEEIPLIFNDNTIVGNLYGSSNDYKNLSIGSVISYYADNENNVYLYDVIGNVTYDGGKKNFSFDPGFKASFEMWAADYQYGESYFYGYIVDFGSNKMKLCITELISDGGHLNDVDYVSLSGSDASLSALNVSTRNANMYTLTGTREYTTQIMVDDYLLGNVDKMKLSDDKGTATVTDDEYQVYYVLVKMYEGIATDIISFDVPSGDETIVTPFYGTPLT